MARRLCDCEVCVQIEGATAKEALEIIGKAMSANGPSQHLSDLLDFAIKFEQSPLDPETEAAAFRAFQQKRNP